MMTTLERKKILKERIDFSDEATLEKIEKLLDEEVFILSDKRTKPSSSQMAASLGRRERPLSSLSLSLFYQVTKLPKRSGEDELPSKVEETSCTKRSGGDSREVEKMS